MDYSKRKILRIEYVDGFVLNDNGDMAPAYKEELLTMSCVRRYYNCMYLLVGLSPSARNLMDYLTEEMNKDNIVYNNTLTRTNFINFIKGITSRPGMTPLIYKDQTVKEAFAQLSKVGLIKTLSRGIFKVDPRFFFKREEKERVADVMVELKFNSTSSNFRIISPK